jgi:hypothetical protein
METNSNKERPFPIELVVDMAITLDRLADKFNLNDGQLDQYDLDWWYYHKLLKRVKIHLELRGIDFDTWNINV